MNYNLANRSFYQCGTLETPTSFNVIYICVTVIYLCLASYLLKSILGNKFGQLRRSADSFINGKVLNTSN